MQAHLNNNSAKQQHLEGETIAFYGDLVSVNKEDVDFHGSITNHDTVLSFVTEHQDDKHFTLMYPQESRSELFSGLHEKIIHINSNTQFMQINNIEEFADYYDNGSNEMDREKHPVESVKMLARQDVLFYDVKERVAPTIAEEKQPQREYMKPTDISFRECMSDLNSQINEVTEYITNFDENKIEKTQDFLDTMNLKGYDARSEEVQKLVNISKAELHQEFSRDYIIPITRKTTIENLDVMLPGKAGKSAADALEFAHNLLGDTNPGKAKLEFECTDVSDCHIKGVYLEKEDTQVKEIGVVLENNASKSHDEMVFRTNDNQTNTQPFNSTKAANQTLEQLNLTDSSQNNEDYAGRTLADDYADMD